MQILFRFFCGTSKFSRGPPVADLLSTDYQYVDTIDFWMRYIANQLNIAELVWHWVVIFQEDIQHFRPIDWD